MTVTLARPRARWGWRPTRRHLWLVPGVALGPIADRAFGDGIRGGGHGNARRHSMLERPRTTLAEAGR